MSGKKPTWCRRNQSIATPADDSSPGRMRFSAPAGLYQSIRIEMFGDLHEYGALGRVVTKSEALKAI